MPSRNVTAARWILAAKWNHNIHHPVLLSLGALGVGRRRVLDVGCGEVTRAFDRLLSPPDKPRLWPNRETSPVVSFLLSVTFACGLLIAVAHVLNKNFVAPVYDVAANLTAFGCAVAASIVLGHWAPATLSGVAISCWLLLARRTILARRQ
jgi:hypothetical protein